MEIRDVTEILSRISTEKELLIASSDGYYPVKRIIEYPEKVIVLLDDFSDHFEPKYSGG